MKTAGDVMLQDMIDNPKDDVLKMIYADWLEDHGRSAEAELIRPGRPYVKHVGDLKWRTLSSFKVHKEGDGPFRRGDTIVLTLVTGEKFMLYHSQDCCETVWIEDIEGRVEDLVGAPLLQAEESSNHDDKMDGSDSHTWTFYKFATSKGYVTIRWYGDSNGYYSESVDFVSIEDSELRA